MLDQKRDIRVLISSDIQGRFQQVIPKVAQLQVNKQFDFMILVGSVCHPRASPFINAVLEGQTRLPLNCYFIDNSAFGPVLRTLHPNGKEVVKGLNYLGRKGMIQIEHLNIAYFNSYAKDEDSAVFESQVNGLLSECEEKTIDILLTNQWSKEAAIISQNHQSVNSANYVGKLVSQICPRYHLVSGGHSFYRMTPYQNTKGSLTHYICVAPCQEQLKDKYLFALTLQPQQPEIPLQGQTNYLENPYTQLQNSDQTGLTVKQRFQNQKQKKLRPKGQLVVFFQSFPDWARNQDVSEFLERWGEVSHLDVYKDRKGGRSGTVRFGKQESSSRCLGDSGKYMFHSTRIKFQPRSLQERLRVEDCWFCKTNADRSLMVWQGRYIYISLEKGPLCNFHIQLIPFNHAQSSTSLDTHEQEELTMVKNRLQTHFADQGYEVVIYQRYLHLSEAVNHCVVHLLPIISAVPLWRAFEVINKDDELRFKEWQGERRGNQHFLHLQLGKQHYIRELQRREKVQADYMRTLLCQLLSTPKKVNWKACQRTNQELAKERTAFEKELVLAGIAEEEQRGE